MEKKIKILITTGIYPPDVGGPATYAENLVSEFKKQGRDVQVVYFQIEKKLPTGIRHLYFLIRLIPKIFGIDLIITLDTFSAGLPTVLVSKIFNKKIILRTGGDFLWEQYVERHGVDLLLRKFYENKPVFDFKDIVIYKLIKYVFKNVTAIIFSTNWQLEIFKKYYNLNNSKCYVVQNVCDLTDKKNYSYDKKIFLWAGRRIKLKNVERLVAVFEDIKKNNPEIELKIVSGVNHNILVEEIKKSFVVILPSLTEISPHLAIEAFAFCKPVIITKENGLSEDLKNLSISVDPLSTKEIKEAVMFLSREENYLSIKSKIQSIYLNRKWKDVASDLLKVVDIV